MCLVQTHTFAVCSGQISLEILLIGKVRFIGNSKMDVKVHYYESSKGAAALIAEPLIFQCAGATARK